jgi:ArsR family transcriptional regulator, arsenate/arsenite/antimonite-responsive transcriptional repressor
MSVMKETIPVTALCCPPLTAGVLDEGAATELAGVLKALADPVRLRLVSAIAAAEAGEVCACDLPELLGRSQPTVSHHLTQLVRAGLLDREQRGKWAWFRLRPDGFAAIRAALGDSPAAAPVASRAETRRP